MTASVSETHWNLPYVEPAFCPSQWVDVGLYLDKKLRALECYKSQIRSFPDARSIEAVEALARWRGCQVGLRAAEAFVTIRRVSPLSMNGREVPASLERNRAEDRRESSIAPRPGPAV